MPTDSDLDRWIIDLRGRLARGEFVALPPFDLGDGTAAFPGELTLRILLADLDHLDYLPPDAAEWRNFPGRRQELRARFRQLRLLLDLRQASALRLV